MKKTINNTTNENKITKVAAYIRFSANPSHPSQSYDTQYEDMKGKIINTPNYEFVDVYADEFSADNKEGFETMVKDALEGKIDLILIKSISRLGRNTVENLNAIRSLRDKGVDVYFENQNVHTTDMSGDLIITIFSSIAQEEEIAKAERENHHE